MEKSVFELIDDQPAPDPKTLARSTDPATSQEAARRIAPAVGGMKQFVARCVRETPGKTAQELAAKYAPTNLKLFDRRLGEAKIVRLVGRGQARVCTVTGFKAATWWPPDTPGVEVGPSKPETTNGSPT